MAFTDRLANRGSISTGAYEVENSCRSESNETDYMHRTPGSSSNRKTFTISFWIKRGKLSALQYLFECGITDNDNGRFFGRFSTSDTFQLYGGSTNWRTTRTVFRDPSAWYHFVIAVDTTLASGNNQFRLYVNGVEETQFSTLNNVTQNTDLGCNFASKHTIGYSSVDSTGVWDGYMSEFVIIDGSQLTPSSFGETDEDSGIWKPKDVSGLTFGTNGTYLDFEASGNLGNDASGGTDWTENNIAATNQTTDSPTNNFCVVNSRAANNYDSPSGTLEMGGNRLQNSGGGFTTYLCTTPFSKGKWYWEMENMGIYLAVGILNVDRTHLLYEVSGAEGVAYRGWNGGALARDGNASIATGVGAPDSSNWVWGFWIDMDNNKFSVANRDGATGTVIDEVDIGNCFTNGRMVIPFVRIGNDADTNINFGNGRWRSDNMMGWYASFSHSGRQDDNGYGNFEYYPNANSKSYYALCSKNIAEFG